MRLTVFLIAILTWNCSQAAQPGQSEQRTLKLSASSAVQYRFRDDTTGFNNIKLSEFKVRGWQIGDRTYFGQTKVGKKWGIGIVVDRGAVKYGVNNRGLKFIREF